jgi:uroporphyrinogen III methyltransferase/synthase
MRHELMTKGKVYLVGAGPGDPGLITVKGLQLLSQAEAVVYDRYVGIELLDNVRADAEKIYVGKTGAQHAKEQHEINQILVDKANEGKMTVRLKGGDPFVFGRGGEEAEVLVENNISFEIVPGITSAIAVPAYAGIPVTHRDSASSFAVVTGHEDPTKRSSRIKWDKLATGVDTLVFLMGMENLSIIVAQLIKHGRPHTTPVAVINDGTRPSQRAVVGTLADIVAKSAAAKLTNPAIIIVGEVASLREKLQWFDNRPLFGKKVLVTRSRHQASALSKLLSERGAIPVELPAIDIQNIAENKELRLAITELASYDWIIFTSVNGVDAFFNELRTLKLDSRALNGIKVGAIGTVTAKAVEAKGLAPDFVPSEFTTDGILADIKKYDIKGKRFLLPRADIVDSQLTDGLVRLGAKVKDVAVYKTLPATDSIAKIREMLLSGGIDIITFASSSTVTNLMAVFPDRKPNLNGTKIACIGPKTAETAVKAGLKPDVVATEHTIPGLVTALEALYSKV